MDNEAALAKARTEALQEILDQQCFAGIAALLDQADSPYVVGSALAKLTMDAFLDEVIPAYLERTLRELDLAFGFIFTRFDSDGWRWADECVALCVSPIAKANFLRSFRFSRSVWDRAENAGDDVSHAYWSTCRPFNTQLDSQDVETAVQKLIGHDRPADTLDLLSMALHKKRVLSAETLLAPLESLLALTAEKSQDQFRRLNARHIQRIIQELQKHSDIDQDRLMKIEWHFIRLLDGHAGHSPRTLQRYLSTSPEFFNEVLSWCYRSRKHEVQNEQNPTEYQRYMAKHAYHLLHDWSLVPGTNEDSSVKEDQLRKWCNEARRIAEETGRLEVCDEQIGQLFARCKSEDPNGKWPCAAVRRVATEIQSE